MANRQNIDITVPLLNLVAQAGGGPFLSNPVSNLAGLGVVIVSNITVFGTSVQWEVRGWDPVSKTDFTLPVAGAGAGAKSFLYVANAVTSIVLYPGIAALAADASGAAFNMVLPRWWKLKVTIVGTVTASATAQMMV